MANEILSYESNAWMAVSTKNWGQVMNFHF